MTRDQAQQLLPIIEAFARGEPLQASLSGGPWMNCGEPDFDIPACQWRIKPVAVERWIHFYADGSERWEIDDRDVPEYNHAGAELVRSVHLREVNPP